MTAFQDRIRYCMTICLSLNWSYTTLPSSSISGAPQLPTRKPARPAVVTPMNIMEYFSVLQLASSSLRRFSSSSSSSTDLTCSSLLPSLGFFNTSSAIPIPFNDPKMLILSVAGGADDGSSVTFWEKNRYCGAGKCLNDGDVDSIKRFWVKHTALNRTELKYDEFDLRRGNWSQLVIHREAAIFENYNVQRCKIYVRRFV